MFAKFKRHNHTDVQKVQKIQIVGTEEKTERGTLPDNAKREIIRHSTV